MLRTLVLSSRSKITEVVSDYRPLIRNLRLESHTRADPVHGDHGYISYIDHLGPMATKLDDIAIMLHVMAGDDGLDARMTPDAPKREQVRITRGFCVSLRGPGLYLFIPT
jgi:hypothetical protein